MDSNPYHCPLRLWPMLLALYFVAQLLIVRLGLAASAARFTSFGGQVADHAFLTASQPDDIKLLFKSKALQGSSFSDILGSSAIVLFVSLIWLLVQLPTVAFFTRMLWQTQQTRAGPGIQRTIVPFLLSDYFSCLFLDTVSFSKLQRVWASFTGALLLYLHKLITLQKVCSSSQYAKASDRSVTAVVITQVAKGKDGRSDNSLVDYYASPDPTYSFRMVYADGIALNSYTIYPQITTYTPLTQPLKIKGGAKIYGGVSRVC